LQVELRLALADSDKKLETLLGTYLAPLLLKLQSPSDRVREKVVRICQHLGVRIKPKYVVS
jgi:proteasome component ECM29